MNLRVATLPQNRRITPEKALHLSPRMPFILLNSISYTFQLYSLL